MARSVTILVVCDEESFVKFIGNFSPSRYAVLYAKNLDHARKHLESKQPRLVVLGTDQAEALSPLLKEAKAQGAALLGIARGSRAPPPSCWTSSSRQAPLPSSSLRPTSCSRSAAGAHGWWWSCPCRSRGSAPPRPRSPATARSSSPPTRLWSRVSRSSSPSRGATSPWSAAAGWPAWGRGSPATRAWSSRSPAHRRPARPTCRGWCTGSR